ncbi:MAG: hypothetical protein P4M14_06075 [Gammaproteobacteria bacterium]|nr:hypothetical protein [Gammaproteobacteria bacterium]
MNRKQKFVNKIKALGGDASYNNTQVELQTQLDNMRKDQNRLTIIDDLKNKKVFLDWNKYSLGPLPREQTQSLGNLQQVQNYVRQHPGMYIGKGKWMITFTGVFLFRDHGTHREAQVNGVLPVEDFKSAAEIDAFCVDAARKYIQENYHESPVDFIRKKDVVAKLMNDLQIKNLRLYGTTLGYKLLPKNIEVNKNGGSCVRNFIMANMTKVFTKYTRVKLDDELMKLEVPPDQAWLDLETIVAWVKLRDCISIWAFNALDELIAKHIATASKTKLSLVFKINNDHLYPIMQDDLKQFVFKTGRINLTKEVFKIKNWNDAVLVRAEDIINNEMPDSTKPRYCMWMKTIYAR